MSRSDFWSRRRAAVEAEAQVEVRLAQEEEAQAEQAVLAEKSDEEVLQELGLPAPETLEAGDDFSAFLNIAVPERLKRIALRRLWSTNPALANLDGLVDYGEDFTDAATVIENMTTAYQVGKGMTTHVEKMAAEAAAEQAEAEAAEAEADDSEVPDQEPATGDAGDEAGDTDAERVDAVAEDNDPAIAASGGPVGANGADAAETLRLQGARVQPGVELGVEDGYVSEIESKNHYARPRRMRYTFDNNSGGNSVKSTLS